MLDRLRNNGFSLTEVLMAAGILAIGFAFIAGLFPVGVKLTGITTEQTIAPIVVDEAIAKIKLYADPNFTQFLSPNQYKDFADVALFTGLVIPDEEFEYPSTDISPELKKYHWSALCGLMPDGTVHVIVFVSRKAGAAARYLTHDSNWNPSDYGQAVTSELGDWPIPVRMVAEIKDNKRKLIITDSGEGSYISTGSTIVDDATGWLYRVIERKLKDDDIIITLDRSWKWVQLVVLPVNVSVWVVPPAVGSGRNPCIRVDPTNTIRF